MSNITGPTQHRHKVGTCPACRCGLWAEVELVVEVGTPTIDHAGRTSVYAAPQFQAMRLDHYCERDEDGEWTYPNDREVGE